MTTQQIDTIYYRAYHKSVKAFADGNQVKGWWYTGICNRLLSYKLSKMKEVLL